MNLTIHPWRQQHRYRWLAGLATILAVAITILTPHDQGRLRMPEPWTYELTAQNFAQGQWTLDKAEMASAHTRVQLAGARLVQFVQIADDTWAFRQSPGHSLEMALFANVGATRLANILLAVLAAALTYAALAAWHSERAAFFGVTLLLWSPLSLLALHYYNMDTFSGGVWPLLAGFAAGWSVDKGRRMVCSAFRVRQLSIVNG